MGISRFLLYLLATVRSLSMAGSTMTLLALSASFLVDSQEGFASSAIYGVSYLGVGFIGLFGGGLLQKFSTLSLGMISPIIGAIIVGFLALFNHVPPIIGLPLVFILFVLNGVEHPNNLRFFNETVEEKKKLSFFSFIEFLTAFLGLLAPVLAGFIIANLGTRICFIINSFTYLLVALSWLLFKRRGYSQAQNTSISWFLGFKTIWQNKDVRSLNISRLLNNMAYVSWLTALPLILVRYFSSNIGIFAEIQGSANSLLALGFILPSLLSSFLFKDNKKMNVMVVCSSLLGFLSVFLLISFPNLTILYLSAILGGIGTYCFRLSGMTLGQAFTPKKALGPTIIAGDTIVRAFSFLISLAVMLIFHFEDSFELPPTLFMCFILFLPACALFAPLFSWTLSKTFVARTE